MARKSAQKETTAGFLPEPSNRWVRKPKKRAWIRPTAEAADFDPSVAATHVTQIRLTHIEYFYFNVKQHVDQSSIPTTQTITLKVELNGKAIEKVGTSLP